MFWDINSVMSHCNGRKRPRSCEEDSCELMPISKRINDLHIRSCCPDSSSMLTESMPEMQPHNRCARDAQGINFASTADMHRQNSLPKDNMLHCVYTPELSLTENPYYYHANEILYQAHLQRQQRLTKPVV
ncbi:uncharacterized protein LOC129217425 [Uloborus diversus]|uniref:uncharacterized protein LOC129217425 n=1 Tax=Uloborus diversus TaxID=327109 RepID=UPI00240964E1|nr:uncharacterized protein LOC129217425 [Uloborus diversus]